ncbi:hypothetical protein AGMMS49543_28050 [Betaproteobacteria bacterium]|nr:hypothetical protein AGMMS49543_28050 [Betaproteobacteria bacterium]GHU25038.1 hypothetical protein AGMMS50243_28790 [Betaproteobacteria bacterium]
MSAFDVMKQTNQLNWHTLLVGFECGWCKKKNLIAYAETCLMQTGNEIDSDLITIASGEEIPEDELVSIGSHFLEVQGHPMSQEAKNESIEKWRFAHLVWLLQCHVSDEEKISLLQELYAQFGFPDDMASCSIYSSNGVDPLVAAGHVVESLSRRLKLL